MTYETFKRKKNVYVKEYKNKQVILLEIYLRTVLSVQKETDKSLHLKSTVQC